MKMILCGLLLGLLSLNVAAQPTAPVEKNTETKTALTAETVLEKNIEALGGRKALEVITSYTIKASMEMPARGVQGMLEVSGKAPDKRLSLTTIKGVGVMRQGYDGKAGWSDDPYQGVRSLAGEELEIVRIAALFNAELKWRELFAKAELTATEADAYVIRLTHQDGSFVTRRYDKQTWMLLREDSLYDSPQGRIAIETRYADYRVVDGVKAAFTWTQKTPVGETVFKIIEVANNLSLDDALFARPSASKPASRPASGTPK